ncbi:MAG TPA: hypothetical protein VIM56_15970 [Rhizomicrobium sp.]
MTQSAALIWFGVIAVLLFATGHLLARKRRAVPASIAGGRPDSMQPLIEAAEAAHKIARDERMALAVVAERSGDPVAFFMRSIASVVGAWRKNDSGGFEAAKGDEDAQSLYIRRGDIDSYLRWARTVK